MGFIFMVIKKIIINIKTHEPRWVELLFWNKKQKQKQYQRFKVRRKQQRSTCLEGFKKVMWFFYRNKEVGCVNVVFIESINKIYTVFFLAQRDY